MGSPLFAGKATLVESPTATGGRPFFADKATLVDDPATAGDQPFFSQAAAPVAAPIAAPRKPRATPILARVAGTPAAVTAPLIPLDPPAAAPPAPTASLPPAPAAPGLASDFGRELMTSGSSLASAAGRVATGVGLNHVGPALTTAADNATTTWQQGLSDAQKAADAQPFLEGGWKNPRKLMGLAAQSAFPTLLGMGLGGTLAKTALAAGLGETTAGIAGNAIGEGTVGGISNAGQVGQQIEQLPTEKLAQTQPYQDAYAATDPTLDPAVRAQLAREVVKNKAMLEAGAGAFVSDAVLGAPAGHALGHAIGGESGRTLRGTLLRQAGLEAAQEGAQGPAEQLFQNEAVQRYADPSQALTEGLAEQAIGGALAGGGLGGALGAGAHQSGAQLAYAKKVTAAFDATDRTLPIAERYQQAHAAVQAAALQAATVTTAGGTPQVNDAAVQAANAAGIIIPIKGVENAPLALPPPALQVTPDGTVEAQSSADARRRAAEAHAQSVAQDFERRANAAEKNGDTESAIRLRAAAAGYAATPSAAAEVAPTAAPLALPPPALQVTPDGTVEAQSSADARRRAAEAHAQSVAQDFERRANAAEKNGDTESAIRLRAAAAGYAATPSAAAEVAPTAAPLALPPPAAISPHPIRVDSAGNAITTEQAHKIAQDIEQRANAAEKNGDTESAIQLRAAAAGYAATPSAAAKARAAREARLPGGLKDPRLARAFYRGHLQAMVDELKTGQAKNAVLNENGGIERRLPSENPDWFKTDKVAGTLSVKDTKAAVALALSGRPLGPAQARAVQGMLDHIQSIRLSPAELDHARATRQAARDSRAQAAPASPAATNASPAGTGPRDQFSDVPFSHPATATQQGLAVGTVQDIAAHTLGRFGTLSTLMHGFGFNVRVVATNAELPAAVQRELTPSARPHAAVAPDGTVYLIASNLPNAKAVEFAVAHEVIGHVGMNQVVKDWPAIVKQLDLLVKAGNTRAVAIDAEVNARYPEANQETYAKEFLAIAAERAYSGALAKLVSRVRAAIQQFLTKFKLGVMGSAQIDALLKQSAKIIGTGARSPIDHAPLFSRTNARETYKFDVEPTTAGPLFINDDVTLFPAGHQFAGLLAGAQGYTAVDTQTGKRLAALVVSLDGNTISDLHWIEATTQGQGAGRKVVQSIVANTPTVKISSILDSAKPFWDRLGATNYDEHHNATITWHSLAAANRHADVGANATRASGNLAAARPGGHPQTQSQFSFPALANLNLGLTQRAALTETREIGRGIQRAAYAVKDKAITQADRAFQAARDAVDRRPAAVRADPLTNYAEVIEHENGRPVADPLLRKFFATNDALLAQEVRDIRALDPEAMLDLIKNYFVHQWTDEKAAEKVFDEIHSKRPFEGSKSHLRQRKHSDYAVGIAAGLIPKYDNFVDAAMARIAQGQHYLAALRVQTELAARGLEWKGTNERAVPTGYSIPHDRAFRKLIPILTTNSKTSEQEAGFMQRLKAYPDYITNDINNLLDPGLTQFKGWRGFRALENTLLTFRLGFSAFHALMTTNDLLSGHVDVAMRQIFRKEFGRGLRSLAAAPKDAILGWRTGAKYIRQMFGEEWQVINTTNQAIAGTFSSEKLAQRNATQRGANFTARPAPVDPELQILFDALTEGGARLFMDPTDTNNAYGAFRRALLRGEALQASNLLKFPLVVAEASTHWIMRHLVPAQKMTARMILARAEFERLGRELGTGNDFKATLQSVGIDELRARMRAVNAVVDDRLGQFAYDNEFWNKALKQILQASVQSVGWNFGTGRVLLGGAKDILHVFKPEKTLGSIDKAGVLGQVNRSRVSNRLSYLISFNATIGLMGMMLQYFLTGEPPDDAKDVFFPRTGKLNRDGTPERLSIPSYMKDEWAFPHAPLQTVLHKLHPFFGIAAELSQNKDFYGNQIINPNDSATVEAQQTAAYLLKGFTPYSAQGALKAADSGENKLASTARSLLGINPAPASVTRSAFQRAIIESSQENKSHGAPRTPEQAARSNQFYQALQQLRRGESPDVSAFTLAEKLKLRQYAHTSAIEATFKGLSLIEMLKAYDKATPEEQAQYHLPRYIFMKNARQTPTTRAALSEDERTYVHDQLAALRQARQ